MHIGGRECIGHSRGSEMQNNASHFFICSGAKVDAKNNDGKTASEVAELNERPEIVVLIEKHEKAAKKT